MSEAIQETWVITDDKSAEWAINQIRKAQDDTAMWESHFSRQLEKVRQANQDTVNFMTAKLEEYFNTLPHKTTKTQESYQLPGAKLVRKQPAPEFVKDDTALVAYLKQAAPECVETIEKPKWGDYKKRCSVIDGSVIDMETGEVVEGVTANERPPMFMVAIKEVT